MHTVNEFLSRLDNNTISSHHDMFHDPNDRSIIHQVSHFNDESEENTFNNHPNTQNTINILNIYSSEEPEIRIFHYE